MKNRKGKKKGVARRGEFYVVRTKVMFRTHFLKNKNKNINIKYKIFIKKYIRNILQFRIKH